MNENTIPCARCHHSKAWHMDELGVLKSCAYVMTTRTRYYTCPCVSFIAEEQ